MNESWLQETMNLIQDWEREMAVLENRIEELAEEIDKLEPKIQAGYDFVQAYKSKHNVSSIPSDTIQSGHFGDKTYPQMLTDIALQSHGHFRVIDVVDILLKANVSSDKRQIQANIYSTLKRLKKKFIKVSPGEYRYANHEIKEQGIGLREAIMELRQNNPSLTKKEAQQVLMKRGFDFKGKKPGNAVNMVWVYLDTHMYARQPSLLG